MSADEACTAFRGSQQVATGSLREIALKIAPFLEGGHAHGVLIFDDLTGNQIDMNVRDIVNGNECATKPVSTNAVTTDSDPAPESTEGPARPGRPKLGVVPREVTLLPRHWEWLASQPGGASVALRKLVDNARKASGDKQAVRQAQEAAYKFMSAMAGNEEGFEEAARALFSRKLQQFELAMTTWPKDVRKHALKLGNSALLAE